MLLKLFHTMIQTWEFLFFSQPTYIQRYKHPQHWALVLRAIRSTGHLQITKLERKSKITQPDPGRRNNPVAWRTPSPTQKQLKRGRRLQALGWQCKFTGIRSALKTQEQRRINMMGLGLTSLPKDDLAVICTTKYDPHSDSTQCTSHSVISPSDLFMLNI